MDRTLFLKNISSSRMFVAQIMQYLLQRIALSNISKLAALSSWFISLLFSDNLAEIHVKTREIILKIYNHLNLSMNWIRRIWQSLNIEFMDIIRLFGKNFENKIMIIQSHIIQNP